MSRICTRLILLLLLSFSGVQAADFKLKLQSGTLYTKENVALFAAEAEPGDVNDGYYYRILQFTTLPDNALKAQMEAGGLRLLNYIPDNAFMTAIPVRYNRNLLPDFGVRSVIRLQDVQKINHRILGELPDYCLNEKGKADITVQYQGNIPHERALILAAGLGKILNSNATNHTIDLRIAENELMRVAATHWTYFISGIAAPSFPEDTKGRSLHRSNVINSDYATGRKYDGKGVVAGLADDGFVGPHIDFTGRLFNYATGAGQSHGDMTSGILAGAGNLDPTIRGMGSGAFLYAYNISGYPHVVNAPANYTTLGTVITSTSYSQGCNEYTTDSEFGDNLLNTNRQLSFVFSAGNNQSGNCNYGAGAGWGNITGGYKMGKNVIACGNLDELEVLDPTSSRGPASDGRIKPDICANGRNQMSTNENNTYQVGGGTSAASPGVAGILTQLYQAYKELNGGTEPQAALIKACVLNSAEDIGNPGPDFTYGWGRINALRAVQTLEENRYLHDSITNGQANTHIISVPAGTNEVRVMVYWNDRSGTPLAATQLVNDINITLSDPSATTFNPWVLDPTPTVAAITSPAVRGTDNLNNMEQVTIANPAAGDYILTVNGGSIPFGPQDYYVVYEFRSNAITVTYPFGGEGFVPGTQEVLRWDATKGLGTYSLEYSLDNGVNWTSIIGNASQNTQQFLWNVPSNVVSAEALVRVTRGADSDVSDTSFVIVRTPQNIAVSVACPDSIVLTWTAVPGATGYTVYRLGSKYMDVAGTTTNTSFTVTNINPLVENWFSVAAQVNGREGRRANAIRQAPGLFNCIFTTDASVQSVNSPAAGTLQDCQDNSALPVTIVFQNSGQTALSNIPVNYQLNNGTVVSEVIAGPVAAGATVNHTFGSTVDLSTTGSYTLTTWSGLSGDQNLYNDSGSVAITVVASVLQSVALVEDFDAYPTCNTSSDCEATVCATGVKWVNASNGDADDIDFRVSSGPTPSANTGPDTDHTTGNASGKYIYLEASTCFNKTAMLVASCVDLSNVTTPQMNFWYHMYGAAMGNLTVDVYSDGAWNLNVMPAISGNQGNNWLNANVNLAAFAGKIVDIRIRAVTGGDFTSDIAIDDIQITDATSAPAVQFMANETSGCPGTTIQFSDMSSNAPTSWTWTISPATFTFANGTTAASQNPQITFNTVGNYDITLSCVNGFGNGTLTQTAYITILAPQAMPVTETFQGVNFPPSGWKIASANGGFTWDSNTVTDNNGALTVAAWVNNFDYNNPQAEDGLATFEIDLSSAISPYLTFDVAHARYNATFIDGLRIDISTDCGLNFAQSGYLKSGTDLATVADQTTEFFPTAAGQWRRDSLDLTAWIGQEIQVKFVNINGYGNNTFLDNVNVSGTVGLHENSALTGMQVYPNPSSGIFRIDLKQAPSEDVRLEVLDLQGRVIRTEQFRSATHTLDLQSQTKGMYLLRLSSAEGESTQRITIL